jgi:hypothetical protein
MTLQGVKNPCGLPLRSPSKEERWNEPTKEKEKFFVLISKINNALYG